MHERFRNSPSHAQALGDTLIVESKRSEIIPGFSKAAYAQQTLEPAMLAALNRAHCEQVQLASEHHAYGPGPASLLLLQGLSLALFEFSIQKPPEG